MYSGVDWESHFISPIAIKVVDNSVMEYVLIDWEQEACMGYFGIEYPVDSLDKK